MNQAGKVYALFRNSENKNLSSNKRMRTILRFRFLGREDASMKANIHPNYREVVFQDLASDLIFKTRSCVPTKETTTFEGEEYPLYKVEISSKSHPFYTGKQNLNPTARQVDKFRQRYGMKK